jgi:hypothetical protein
MTGKKIGLMDRQNPNCYMKLHLSICGNTLNFKHVSEVVVSAVNFSLSQELNHCQFQSSLLETIAEYGGILYHIEVWWLSCGNIQTFFNTLRTGRLNWGAWLLNVADWSPHLRRLGHVTLKHTILCTGDIMADTSGYYRSRMFCLVSVNMTSLFSYLTLKENASVFSHLV